MENIIRRYQLATGKRVAESDNSMDILKKMNGEMRQLAEEAEALELSLERYKGQDLSGLHHEDLLRLEQELEISVRKVRSRKNELMHQQMENLRKKEIILKEQNQRIHNMMKEQQIQMEYTPEMEVGMMTYMKQEDDVTHRQILEQFPFFEGEQPNSILQLSTFPPPPQLQPYDHHHDLLVQDFTLRPPN